MVAGEPTLDDAREGVRLARAHGVSEVVGIGGGAVLDAAKAAAALAPNPKDGLEYLEVIGGAQPLTADSLPYLAIPTTAGTGSEVTKNAVLGSPTHGVKASLRSNRMVPRAALVDPSLTLGCPPAVTAASGLDAITQLIEPFLSPAANPFTDALVADALPRALRALPLLLDDPRDLAARADMSYAALVSGLALSNAKLGVVHGIAGPLGGRRPIPHGAICARLLVPSLSFNLARMTNDRPLELARLVLGRADGSVAGALDHLSALVDRARIPGFAAAGLVEADLVALANQSLLSGSTKGNPVPVTREDVIGLLRLGM